MKEFNVNFIKRENKQKKPNEKKILSTDEEKQVIAHGTFYSPSGKHERKMEVYDSKYKRTQYDFIDGNHSVDLSDYAVASNKKDMTMIIRNHRVVKDEAKQVETEKKIPVNTIKVVAPTSKVEVEPVSNSQPKVEVVKEEIKETKPVEVIKPIEEKMIKEEVKQPQPTPVKVEQNLEDLVNWQHDNNFEEKSHEKYEIPTHSLLKTSNVEEKNDNEWCEEKKSQIDEILASYNIKAHVAGYIVGPDITEFLIDIAPGVSVKRLTGIEADIQRRLCLEKDRNIFISESVPRTAYAGIQVPNRDRKTVFLGDIIQSEEFKNPKYHLPIAIGLDSRGEKIVRDIVDFPHAIIAGGTKSGKTVQLHSIIISLIVNKSPEEMRLILSDPKRMEFNRYVDIPHLALPVIFEEEEFYGACSWLKTEMDRREKIQSEYGANTFELFNRMRNSRGEKIYPYIVYIADEFGDWFQDAPEEVQMLVQKLAAKGRAVGIHLLFATQRPSADIISGNIKNNFDSRFAFRVNSYTDSQIVLGRNGAERLLKFGDMLFSFSGSEPDRIKGSFISDDDGEITNVVMAVKKKYPTNYYMDLDELRALNKKLIQKADINNNTYEVPAEFEEVARYCVLNNVASKNAIQVKFGFGNNKVRKIFEHMIYLGIVSDTVPGRAGEVLVDIDRLEEILKEEDEYDQRS